MKKTARKTSRKTARKSTRNKKMNAIKKQKKTLEQRGGEFTWPQLKQFNIFNPKYDRSLKVPVLSVSFSPNGKRIVCGCADGTIRLFSMDNSVEIKQIDAHKKRVVSVSFSANGSQIVSGSYDNTIKIWSSTTGNLIRTLTGHTDLINSVSVWCGDDNNIANIVSGSDDSTVRVWDAITGRETHKLPFEYYGNHISQDGTSKFGEYLSLRCRGKVKAVSFSHDGKKIVGGSSYGFFERGEIYLWKKTEEGEWMVHKTINKDFDDLRPINSLSYSPDGSRIVSGSDDMTIRVWDAETGEVIKKLTGHSYAVYSVSFSVDGSRIVSGGRDHTIRLWDAETRREINTFTGNRWEVTSVSISTDGSHIVSGGDDGTVRVWDAEVGNPTLTQFTV
jgi:WD40 repeat protein